MRFSRNFISYLLSVIPLETVISEEGVELLPKGKNFLGLCPFHDDRTASFLVISEKQFYYCFGCGCNGGIFDFLMKFNGCSFLGAVIYLCEK